MGSDKDGPRARPTLSSRPFDRHGETRAIGLGGGGKGKGPALVGTVRVSGTAIVPKEDAGPVVGIDQAKLPPIARQPGVAVDEDLFGKLQSPGHSGDIGIRQQHMTGEPAAVSTRHAGKLIPKGRFLHGGLLTGPGAIRQRNLRRLARRPRSADVPCLSKGRQSLIPSDDCGTGIP